MSTEDSGVMSSEDSSSPEEEAELELGLGLGLGVSSSGGFGFKGQQALKGHRYARILTAQDLPFVVSATSSPSPSPSSSSSSSSSCISTTSSSSFTLSRANVIGAVGTKRSADPVTPHNVPPSHVVGWPPLRPYRINSMVNQGKSLTSEEFNSTIRKNNSMSAMVDKAQNVSNTRKANFKVRTSLLVKVNMDGIPIGRKVDLNAHGCYENLAQALEDMFLRTSTIITATRSRASEHNIMGDASRCSRLLDGSSQYVLTYEDKEGDWMLVGDVPWRMFLSSVKRLRITRTYEATGLGRQM